MLKTRKIKEHTAAFSIILIKQKWQLAESMRTKNGPYPFTFYM